MTVAALTETRAQISGDGVTDRVDLPFQFVDQNDLKVIHTDSFGVDTEWNYQQSPGSWYFSGGNYATGTVLFSPADLVAGDRLTVVLTSRYDQPQTLSGGEIDPDVIERSMDRTALQVQAIAGRVSRSLSISPSLAGALPGLEVPDLQDGEGFVRQGDKLVPAPIDSGGIATAVTAAQAAQTVAEAAKTDAEAAESSAQSARSGAETAQSEANQAKTDAEAAQSAAEAAAISAGAAATAAVAPIASDLDTAETEIVTLQGQQLGVGQTWTNPGRTAGIWYQNTNTRPIMVGLRGGSNGSAILDYSQDGVTADLTFHHNSVNGAQLWNTIIIPPGDYFRFGGFHSSFFELA
ncbi:MAG: hypothetical protein RIE06_22805 [Roseibium album]|uniref:hypothetical protein n=1 Tax=Roseibium album TaxID=311410 RepID=UPI0032F09B05